jgi:7-carboxy-7-deazaguanine synthase
MTGDTTGDKPTTLKINEIFFSIQGESTFAGLPCVFVRLTGCHLRCGYCDTEYAFHEGSRWTVERIIEQVRTMAPACRLVEVTGGEPLLQKGVHELMTRLADGGYTVLLETSGACDISPCDERVRRIMDFKTPGSGEAERNLWSNVDHLRSGDEVKFVLTSRADYDWAVGVMKRYDLNRRVGAVLMSAVHESPPGAEVAGSTGLPIRDLAQWILEDHLDVRLQTQLHKIIWEPQTRGV